MLNRLSTALAACGAVVVLGVAANLADATRIGVSNLSFRMIFSELRFQGGGIERQCPITLEGTIHERILVKISGTLIGMITNASSNSTRCRTAPPPS